MNQNINQMPGGCGFSEKVYTGIIGRLSYPSSILELGCGNGGNLAKFDKAKNRVGIDPYIENIKLAHKKYGGTIKVSQGSHRSLAIFKQNEFDVGFSVSVLDHIKFPKVAIERMIRICKKLILIEPYIEGEGRQAKKGESSNWKITWYHNYCQLLEKVNKKICFSITPFPLYSTKSGPLFHLVEINK